MNCWNLASTNAQQAPLHPSGCIPPWTTVAQAERSAPVQTALTKSQSNAAGTDQSRKASASTVRMVSFGVASRFSLTHATAPRRLEGAGSASSREERTNELVVCTAILPLHQCHSGI